AAGAGTVTVRGGADRALLWRHPRHLPGGGPERAAGGAARRHPGPMALVTARPPAGRDRQTAYGPPRARQGRGRAEPAPRKRPCSAPGCRTGCAVPRDLVPCLPLLPEGEISPL